MIAWTIIEILLQVGFGLWLFSKLKYFSTTSSNSTVLVINFRQGLRPWVNWANVKTNFSAVWLYPEAMVPESEMNSGKASYMIAVVASFAFFLVFGFSEESKADYGRAIRWFRRTILRQKLSLGSESFAPNA